MDIDIHVTTESYLTKYKKEAKQTSVYLSQEVPLPALINELFVAKPSLWCWCQFCSLLLPNRLFRASHHIITIATLLITWMQDEVEVLDVSMQPLHHQTQRKTDQPPSVAREWALALVLVVTTFSHMLPRPFLSGCFGRHDLFSHVATTVSCGLFLVATTFSCGLFWSP